MVRKNGHRQSATVTEFGGLRQAVSVRTTVLPTRGEVEDQTGAYNNVLFLAMLALVHEQKILLEDGQMPRMQVDGRHVH